MILLLLFVSNNVLFRRLLMCFKVFSTDFVQKHCTIRPMKVANIITYGCSLIPISIAVYFGIGLSLILYIHLYLMFESLGQMGGIAAYKQNDAFFLRFIRFFGEMIINVSPNSHLPGI